ncbi:dTDP-4-dehydrorhamnose reductase [Noviherbaspirillum aridicola]|uniref:dTDP-4-dehydrorhamnose reductase n=1 Tax=Noviherbaspirillum aridicola TaxID=2849687 RepID=A0ABQ4Q3K1_9BURK|nr:dTDP-4-dehydrorhamnose reductase [Noviherbaspirillum aridicola]GIZ51617.1 NAD(P)-dependent oxidoreductase [Noviherbaspirillum aridicola]
MKILLTGAGGQIGYELLQCLQGRGELLAPGRDRLDLERPDQLRELIRAWRPDVVVNAAAYTAVDQAEREPDAARRVNAAAPAAIGEAARQVGAAVVHFSTDYVFDGRKLSPYEEDDPTGPLNVYGQSKREGEQALLASGARCLLLRTSWVYGLRGRNFLLTVLRLARERDSLRIVADQYGAPTWSRSVAQCCARVLAQAERASDRDEWWALNGGIFHMSAQGRTSWYGFTRSALERMRLPRTPAVHPIASHEYPTPAKRPAYSVLSGARLEQHFGLRMPHWEQSLADCLASGAPDPV